MIDLKTEEVFSLAEIVKQKFLPQRRSGKRPNVATLFRWAQRGFRGEVLETIRIGGTKCTSREALQRFFDRLSQIDSRPTLPETPRHRERAIDQTLAELAA